MFPQSPQEFARARHADLLREATQERLAAIAREGDPDQPVPVRFVSLRRVAAAARRVGTRHAAVRTA